MLKKYDFLGNNLDKYKTYAPLLLRVVIGIIFIAHGYGKIWGSAPGFGPWLTMVARLGFPSATFTAWLVALVELVGGIALILGIFTRYAAVFLAIIMVVATIKVKLSLGLIGGYELDLSLFAGTIALVLLGGGELSLDKKICGK